MEIYGLSTKPFLKNDSLKNKQNLSAIWLMLSAGITKTVTKCFGGHQFKSPLRPKVDVCGLIYMMEQAATLRRRRRQV